MASLDPKRGEIVALMGFESEDTHEDHIMNRLHQWREQIEYLYQLTRNQLSTAASELDRAPYLPGNVERCMELSDKANELYRLLGGQDAKQD